MSVILDYVVFVLLISFLLVGLVLAFYFWRKKDKFPAGVIFFIWLAFSFRLHLFLIPMFLMDIPMENFSASFVGIIFRWIGDFLVSLTVLLMPILFVCIFYFFFKKKFAYAALSLVLIFPAHISYMESYFLFYPLVDTTKSSKFTLKSFDMIHPGMTRDQVRALISDPVANAGQYNAPCEGQTGDSAAPFPYDFAWLNSSVCYDESDKVVETKKIWVPD